MATVKDIMVKVIPSSLANDFVRKHHYSGKVVPNSQLHFGAFLDGFLHGVMSYGCPLKKSGVIGLVKDTRWNGFVELNRMAFDDTLPRNSESRCLAISFKLIKKNAPHIKWILSFSDGTQSGDGTIYRAAGFHLTQIKRNTQLRVDPKTGKPMQSMQAFHLGLTKDFVKWGKLEGFQLRYIYLLDKTAQLTVPIIPYSKIDEIGAGMYLGEKITVAQRNQSK